MDDRTRRAARRVEGGPLVPGIALGRLVRLAPAKHETSQSRTVAEEHRALVVALLAAKTALTVLAQHAGDDDAEAILSFQIALLEDDNLAEPAFALIVGGQAAHGAWSTALDSQIASFDGADDAYFRSRPSSLRDVRYPVLLHL